MARTQKNKATSFHLGQLKAKLAKLKRELLTPSSGSGGGGGAGFDVARTGVASVGFIGFPSVGKSTLMSKVTGQHSEVAAYEFTTLTSVPGQVVYNGGFACLFFLGLFLLLLLLSSLVCRKLCSSRRRCSDLSGGASCLTPCCFERVLGGGGKRGLADEEVPTALATTSPHPSGSPARFGPLRHDLVRP